MTLVSIPGDGMWCPAPLLELALNPAFTPMTCDADGEKAAFVGRVKFNARTGTKTIDKVHYRTGATITGSGGSVIRVGLQAISLVTTSIITPDEVLAQYRDVAISALTANTWTTTGLITADGTDGGAKRSVSYNELLGVVFEFDPATWFTPDVFTVVGLQQSIVSHYGQGISVAKVGTWAKASLLPNVILEFSDGTFGTLDGGWPASALGTITYNSGSPATDEYANEFQVPFPCKTDGFWVMVWCTTNAANFDVVLYEGTTALQTVTIDANAVLSVAGTRWFAQPWTTEQALSANTTYRLAFKPGATDIRVDYFDVAAAGHFACHAFGNFPMNSRLNAGAWADTGPTTRRLFAGLRFSAFGDDAGGASGPVGHQCM